MLVYDCRRVLMVSIRRAAQNHSCIQKIVQTAMKVVSTLDTIREVDITLEKASTMSAIIG